MVLRQSLITHVYLPHARMMLEVASVTGGEAVLRIPNTTITRKVYDFKEQIAKMQYLPLTQEEHDNFHHTGSMI